jgi:hypothetical protein
VRFLRVVVKCESPEYVKGNYEYTGLEGLFNFLLRIKRFPRGLIRYWLWNVAKEGFIGRVSCAMYDLEINADFHDYQLAKKIAEETRLLGAFDKVSENLDVALRFARAFDREADSP